MDLRTRGLEIDAALREEYLKWKEEVARLEAVIKEQDAILASPEAKGDRSENAIFLNAADTKQQSAARLRAYEDRIATYQNAYELYSTENYVPDGTIKIGSVVRFVIEENNKEMIIKLVPVRAGAPLKGAVQENSPIGRQLLGKREGEIAVCTTERGTFKYHIKEVY